MKQPRPEVAYPAEEAEYRVLDDRVTETEPQVLKAGDQFAVFDRWGDMLVNDPAAKGLFRRDTRHLSRWELRLFGARPLLLSSGNRSAVALTTDLANPDYYTDGEVGLGHNTIHIARTKFLAGDSCFELIRVRNFSLEEQRVSLTLSFEADFRDIFEVRGHARAARGRRAGVAASPSGPTVSSSSTRLGTAPRPPPPCAWSRRPVGWRTGRRATTSAFPRRGRGRSWSRSAALARHVSTRAKASRSCSVARRRPRKLTAGRPR
jgi:glycogen debranching enzyme